MLAYFAYQYLMYVTGWTYNNFFLLYVALHSLPIVALILVVQEIGVGTLARRVSEKSPVKGLAGFMFAVLASVGTGFLVALLRPFRPAESRRAV